MSVMIAPFHRVRNMYNSAVGLEESLRLLGIFRNYRSLRCGGGAAGGGSSTGLLAVRRGGLFGTFMGLNVESLFQVLLSRVLAPKTRTNAISVGPWGWVVVGMGGFKVISRKRGMGGSSDVGSEKGHGMHMIKSYMQYTPYHVEFKCIAWHCNIAWSTARSD